MIGDLSNGGSVILIQGPTASVSAMPNSAGFRPEAVDPFLFRRARTWWLILALFLMADGGGLFSTQGIHPGAGNMAGGGAVEQSSTSIQLTSGAMWLICVGLIFRHVGPVLKLMFKQKAALGFAVLALLSTLWSQAPSLTTRKAIMLFLYFLFAWFFVTYYRPADQMRLFFLLGVVMGIWSVLWSVFLPKYGVHGTGEWKGIFGQKNFLGSTMCFLFSGLPFVPIPSFRTVRKLLIYSLLPLGLILFSKSRTSLIMAFLIVAVRILGPRIVRMRREALPFVLYCLGACVAMVTITLGIILPLLGRDLTLTGRTHYWGLLLPLALKRLWLGYGYQAFFASPSGDAEPIRFGTGTGNIFSVDNGYLDIALQCGLAGLGLVFALLITSMRDFLVLIRRSSVPLITFWYAGLVLTIFVGSVTENMLWKPIRIVPFILAFASSGLGNLRYQITSASRPPSASTLGRKREPQ